MTERTAVNADLAGPVRLLGGEVVDELASVELGLAAAEAAARLDRSKVVTGRVQVDGDVSWMRILAGSLTDLDVTGYKEFHRVGQRVRYHVHLYRESTGDHLGTVDGRRITSLRTSSTAAVAVRAWARAQGRDRKLRVGLIGSGEEAREGLRALHGAIDIDQARVFSPTPANRKAFAASMSAALDLEVEDQDHQEDVLANSDVLYVATSSHGTPFLGAAELADVPMVAAIGSTAPVHRELRGDAFHGATVVMDTRDAAHESGDCIEAISQGWDPGSVVLLSDYLAGDASVSQRTIFKSIGSVEQDLVLALHLLDAAAQRDAGVTVDPIGSLRVMR